MKSFEFETRLKNVENVWAESSIDVPNVKSKFIVKISNLKQSIANGNKMNKDSNL